MGSGQRVARGLADALFAKTQQRVLGLLFGSPDRSYFANEIVRMAKSGTGAVHRELDALEAAGLVTSTRSGNQKHFRANRASPIFAELHGIAVKTFGVADVLREALAPVASGIRAAFIYGSVAKGTDTATSDIDLMLISDRVTYSDFFEIAEKAERRLMRKVKPAIYPEAALRRLALSGNAFVNRVLAQPKVFLVGSENELRELGRPRKGRAPQG
jgi:predicted nucleotidyltransferase